MNTVHDPSSPDDDIYDPDDVGQNSPPFKPMKVNLEPSLSPPPTIPGLSESPRSSPGSPSRRGPSRPKYRPSPGDAVLVSFMAGGKHLDVARDAGQQPLACENEAEDPVKAGGAVVIEENDEAMMDGASVDINEPELDTTEPDTNQQDTSEQNADDQDKSDKGMAEEVVTEKNINATAEDESMVVVAEERVRPDKQELPPIEAIEEVVTEESGFDLKALAARAMLASTQTTHGNLEPGASPVPAGTPVERSPPKAMAPRLAQDQMEGIKMTMPPIKTLYVEGIAGQPSEIAIKREVPAVVTTASSMGELPPIRHTSPQLGLSNGSVNGQITLPSISDQLGDINHLPEPASATDSAFSQSPPGRPPPRFAAVPPGHGSPNSPNDTFQRRELPSPGRAHFYPFANSHRRQSQSDHQYTSPADYSSSNTETPNSDQSGSTPATMGIDRMSIDGITNPQIGGFQCTYLGCTAQPFQTQYLLNSHANVHSSNRPHYCSVKGCPRSEGGKGFKRKNEMIRHGLVHDSPGYVCPFCPDREHKYPRPDNLQRHVRVHHVDKDKDDAQLREVLSQRPEGPSRGRRRRGGTG